MGLLREVLYSIETVYSELTLPLVHLEPQVATHRLHHQQQAIPLFKKYL